jgi:tetrapyrrole methylase family protein / MazG family protein
MAHITIVGLGPGSKGALTLEAWQVLQEAEEVWLRTSHHPVLRDLTSQGQWRSFDAVYEGVETFEAVYAQIVAEVLALGQRPEGVIYAVPGHPLVGESTVTQILSSAARQSIPVHVIHGLSFIEPSLTALNVDALDGLQIFDALDIVALHYPPLNPDVPALIAQVYSRPVASELKLVLMNQFPDEHPVVLLDAAGTEQQRVLRLPLYEIDRHEVSALTSLYITPMAGVTGFEGFQETIATLRSPEGCPWDREQTHQTLRTNLLEECYEVLEAIDADDPLALREELGDLLLQIVLHAQIAVEDGDFYMPEVIAHIDAKLKRRHPHVWGSVNVEGVNDVVVNWEVIKQRERTEKGTGERSLLQGIPLALPALAQAVAYADRAGRIGFDRIDPEGIWVELPESLRDVLQRLLEELDAVRAASDDDELEGGAQVLGALFLVIADWARRHDIDPESALREANAQFAERFHALETISRQTGVALNKLSPDEIRRQWNVHEQS